MVCTRPLGVGGGVWSGSWVDDVFSVEGAEVGSVLMWIELAAVSAALFNATAVGMNKAEVTAIAPTTDVTVSLSPLSFSVDNLANSGRSIPVLYHIWS